VKARAAMAVGAVAALIVTLFVMSRGRPGAALTPAVSRAPVSSSDPAATEPQAVPVATRNVFEYATEEPPPDAPSVDVPTADLEPPMATEPSPSPVRLVGLVRRQGRLKAALSIEGDVAVLGPGESARGYTVVGVDEESGARLRAPDGSELVLPAPIS
jgi:hypothetical protein